MDEQQRHVSERSLEELVEDQLWDEAYARFVSNPGEAKTIANPSVGWTRLHLLCSIGSTPARLVELVASLYPEAVTMPDNRYGDTPLHIICRNSQTSAKKLKILLSYLENSSEGVLIRNRFGGTALHSASNHNAVLEALQELVKANPRILRVTTHEGIHAVSALYQAYIHTIPGMFILVRILEGEARVEDPHFDRFWRKVEFLATQYFWQSPACPTNNDTQDRNKYILHGLIRCNVHIKFFNMALKRYPYLAQPADGNGNLPLHLLVENRPFRLKERDAIAAILEAYNRASSISNDVGEVPLTIAIRNKIPWDNGVDLILEACPSVIQRRDVLTRLLPFQLAAAVGGRVGVETTYQLLITQPDLLAL